MFLLELALLIFSDFSQNTGTTKGVVILYFVLTYVWFTIPAILSIILANRLEQRNVGLIVLLILNMIILIRGIPMFLAYL